MAKHQRLNKKIEDPQGNVYCVAGYFESSDGARSECRFAVDDVRIFRFWGEDCWDIVHQVVEDKNKEKWWKVVAVIKYSGGRWVIDRKKLREWGFSERAIRTATRDLARVNLEHSQKYDHPVSDSVFDFLRGRRVSTHCT